MDDKSEMQARAETAPKTKRSKGPLELIIARAYRQDGIGLTAGEVLRLADAASVYGSSDPTKS